MLGLVATFLAASTALQHEPPKRPCPPTEEISYAEASRCVGEVRRVVGRLDHVSRSRGGVLFLNFCPDWRNCPFNAVVFRDHLQKFADVTASAGREVEVSGRIEAYKGKPQIVLENPTQLVVRAPPKRPAVVQDVEEKIGDSLKPIVTSAVEEKPAAVPRAPVWHAAAYVGKHARIAGRVAEVASVGNDLVVHFEAEAGQTTFVAVVLEPNVPALAEALQEWPGRRLELEGDVTLFDGRPAIFVSDHAQATLAGR